MTTHLTAIWQSQPLRVLVLRKSLGWLQAIPRLTQSPAASFEYYLTGQALLDDARAGQFAICECDPRDCRKTCRLVHQLCQSGVRVIVAGPAAVDDFRLCFSQAGAITTVTSIFQLDRVTYSILQAIKTRPQVRVDWRQAMIGRLPWKPVNLFPETQFRSHVLNDEKI